MVSYVVTPKISAFVAAILSDPVQVAKLDVGGRAGLDAVARGKPLGLGALKGLKAALAATGAGDGPYLHELLCGGGGVDLAMPQSWHPPVKPPKTPGQVAYKAKLEREAGNRQYADMTKSVTARERRAKDLRDGGGLRDMHSQMSMGANVIVAMATMFTVGYFCAGVRGYDQKAKLICGLVCLILTMFMEVVLLMIYVYKHEKDDNTAEMRKAKAAMRAAAEPLPKLPSKVE